MGYVFVGERYIITKAFRPNSGTLRNPGPPSSDKLLGIWADADDLCGVGHADRVCARGSVAPAVGAGGARTQSGKRVGGRVIGFAEYCLAHGWEGFLRHGRALKQGWPICRRGFWPPRRGRRRFVALIQLSLGRLLLSRACFCFTGQNQRVSRFRSLGGL